MGLIVTEKGTYTNFSLVNGVRFHKFFVGIGANTQFQRRHVYYNYWNPTANTSAIYIDGRYYINKKKNFFCKVNGGVNILTGKLESSANYNYKKLTGYYGAFGLGFKARIGKEIFYSFDVNYCLRQTRYNYNYLYYGNKLWQTEKYDFRQSAIIVTMGIEIF